MALREMKAVVKVIKQINECHSDNFHSVLTTIYITTTMSCIDINECERNLMVCSENEVCVNTLGSYTCQCLSGYYKQSNSCKGR